MCETLKPLVWNLVFFFVNSFFFGSVINTSIHYCFLSISTNFLKTAVIPRKRRTINSFDHMLERSFAFRRKFWYSIATKKDSNLKFVENIEKNCWIINVEKSNYGLYAAYACIGDFRVAKCVVPHCWDVGSNIKWNSGVNLVVIDEWRGLNLP